MSRLLNRRSRRSHCRNVEYKIVTRQHNTNNACVLCVCVVCVCVHVYVCMRACVRSHFGSSQPSDTALHALLIHLCSFSCRRRARQGQYQALGQRTARQGRQGPRRLDRRNESSRRWSPRWTQRRWSPRPRPSSIRKRSARPSSIRRRRRPRR